MPPTVVIVLLAAYVLVGAGGIFYLNVRGLWRRTGYAAHIGALKALVFLVVAPALMLLAWGVACLCLAPGTWRMVAAIVIYAVLMKLAGSPAMRAAARAVERWYLL